MTKAALKSGVRYRRWINTKTEPLTKTEWALKTKNKKQAGMATYFKQCLVKTATNQNGKSHNGDKKRLYRARLAST